MITDDIRTMKKQRMNDYFLQAVSQWEFGQTQRCLDTCNRLAAFSVAFSGIDRDLFTYAQKLDQLVTDFITSDVKDFTAWAMLKACEALKGLQLDPVSTADHGPLDPSIARANILAAQQWRTESGYTPQLTGGYVIVYAGQVAGWINELRDPSAWQPGVFAVDHHGNQHLAIGFDPVNGATAWNLVCTAQPQGVAA
jgi:hypothetical protein